MKGSRGIRGSSRVPSPAVGRGEQAKSNSLSLRPLKFGDSSYWKGEVCVGLWFQREAVHWGGKGRKWGRSRKLVE